MRRLSSRQMGLSLLVLLAVCQGLPAVGAEEVYYQVQLGDLKIVDGRFPSSDEDWSAASIRRLSRGEAIQPRVAVEGAEAYLVYNRQRSSFEPWPDWKQVQLVMRAPGNKPLTGLLVLPRPDFSGMERLRFTFAPTEENAKVAAQFFNTARQQHYTALVSRQAPGSAWFRYQARQSNATVQNQTPQDDWRAEQEMLDRFALFSGGRAISENLQLDRPLVTANAANPAATELVEVDSLPGITVTEIDWKPLLKDASPRLDPLASVIPADQHAVFFPSFAAVARLRAEADRPESSLFRLGTLRSEDARSVAWYETQIGLPLTIVGRIIGPRLIDSVALTGSDPYFTTGTDIAVLFASKQPEVLGKALLAQMQVTAGNNDLAKPQSGDVNGVAYRGFLSPDRRTSGYVAQLPGDVVVVTNSVAQLRKLVRGGANERPPLASLDDYKFFRTRYPLDADQETALIFLSDATIRRWCSARWRIAAARRIYNAAVMADLQAAHFDALAKGTARPEVLKSDYPLNGAGELSLTSAGVVSSTQGSLAWQTPIIELDLQQVTREEVDAYGRWRDMYQRNWSWAFDPIALRILANDDTLDFDLTVMPLIAGTEYREMIELSRGAKLASERLDVHDALVHFAIALNRQSQLFQQGRNMASMLTPDPFGWLGESVEIYLDDDPLWAELASLPQDELDKKLNEISEQYIGRLPVGVRAEVANPLKLTAVLGALRALIEQAAPGMVTWENLTHREQAYVKVAPTAPARAQLGNVDVALYYSPSPNELVVSLNEAVMKRALERRADRLAGKKPEAGKAEDKQAAKRIPVPWLGENVCVVVDQKAVDLMTRLWGVEAEAGLQARSWSNLPILNEWKRLFPDQDPVKLHEQFWHTRLVCPAGGEYVWNPTWQTMESTATGHPGEPKAVMFTHWLEDFESGSFGLTFEPQGLRARVRVERK